VGVRCGPARNADGKRPFEGETVSDVIASVLKDAPDLSTLRPDTPGPILTLLRRCLEKDRRKRLDSAGAARLEIDDAITGGGARFDTPDNPGLRLSYSPTRKTLLTSVVRTNTDIWILDNFWRPATGWRRWFRLR
jgi:hypothetical protein